MKFGINNPAWLQAAGNRVVGTTFFVEALNDCEFSLSGTRLGDFSENLEISFDNGESWENPSIFADYTLSQNGRMLIRNKTKVDFEPQLFQRKFVDIDANYKIGGDLIGLFYPKGLPTNGFKMFFLGDQYLSDVSQLELRIKEVPYGCFDSMFKNCASLVAAPELPATTIGYGGYGQMFSGCENLSMAPQLPALTLDKWCYSEMFKGCVSLMEAPELPATILAENCYALMFDGCNEINKVTCLAENIPNPNCTTNWLRNVAEIGTFTKAAGVEWPEGVNGIPTGWTVQDYVG